MAFENDPEGYRMAQRYAGSDFDKAKAVTIEPLYQYSGEWRLDEFQHMIAEAIATIPPECRESARVELEDQGYDSGSKFSISYVGLESAETVAERIRRCEEYVSGTRATERAAYERLKAKFG